MTILCSRADLHPYECEGWPECPHCARRHVKRADGTLAHDPATCELCDPEYDHQVNEFRKEGAA